jgi:hypothetical protein
MSASRHLAKQAREVCSSFVTTTAAGVCFRRRRIGPVSLLTHVLRSVGIDVDLGVHVRQIIWPANDAD